MVRIPCGENGHRTIGPHAGIGSYFGKRYLQRALAIARLRVKRIALQGPESEWQATQSHTGSSRP